ncbi:hypothetical protein ACEPAI_1944 [Sanghuangporus weigelae]
MDVFVREVRVCFNGDIVIVRLGSCRGLSVYLAGTFKSFMHRYLACPYEVSKDVAADPELHDFLADKLKNAEFLEVPVMLIDQTVNASTDSFYSSQGRQTGFPDRNETLIDYFIQKTPGLATFEMEMFHLFHLASSWRCHRHESGIGSPTDPPASLIISPSAIPPLGGVMSESGCSPDINSGQATGNLDLMRPQTRS